MGVLGENRTHEHCFSYLAYKPLRPREVPYQKITMNVFKSLLTRKPGVLFFFVWFFFFPQEKNYILFATFFLTIYLFIIPSGFFSPV